MRLLVVFLLSPFPNSVDYLSSSITYFYSLRCPVEPTCFVKPAGEGAREIAQQTGKLALFLYETVDLEALDILPCPKYLGRTKG